MDGSGEQELAAHYSWEGTASTVPKIRWAEGFYPEVNALEKDSVIGRVRIKI
jgi:hypothetical protein